MRLYSVCEDGFVLCNKPALWISPGYSAFEEIYFGGYPYISKDQFDALEEHEVVFFQNDKLLQNALARYISDQVKRSSPQFHWVMGHILGYPPRAVDFFVKCQQDPTLQRYQATLRYCGVECVSATHDLFADVKWLWDHYPYPDLDTVFIELPNRDKIDIPYRDFDKLRFVHNYFARLL